MNWDKAHIFLQWIYDFVRDRIGGNLSLRYENAVLFYFFSVVMNVRSMEVRLFKIHSHKTRTLAEAGFVAEFLFM